MARYRMLQSVTKKERRAELQENIMTNLSKQKADREFVTKWYQAFVIHKICTNLKKKVQKKQEEARFMAQVFWTVLKIKMRMGTKLRR